MRFAAIFALVLGLGAAACATAPAYVVTEHAVLPVEQAIGLTRSEVADRLGLKAQTRRLVHVAELKNNVLHETVRNSEYDGAGVCPAGMMVGMHWRYGEQSAPYVSGKERWAPPSLYRENRYAGPAVNPARKGDDARQPAYIIATCMTPPHVPDFVDAALHDARQPQSHDVNPTLASLRLGSPPPGGLDAWSARLPADVRLLQRDAREAVFAVYSRVAPDAGTARTQRVTVSIQDGVVSRLESGLATECELAEARFFRCAYAGVSVP